MNTLSSSDNFNMLSFLGCASVVHLSISHTSSKNKNSPTTVNGSLLEVRRLWRPYFAASSTVRTQVFMTETECHNAKLYPLYAYIRIKDTYHRFSGWFPLHQVELKDAPLCCGKDSHLDASLCDSSNLAQRKLVSVFANEVIFEPILSSIYTKVTAGMARTQRAEKQINYLEERLLRDGMTPTTIRNFVFLNRYVFRAWYYAPYGLLHSEYDPVVPVHLNSFTPSEYASTGPYGERPEASASHLVPRRQVSLSPNPYIKDAFLCPFSLRLYTTYEQMCYETRTYRSGQLRPPGTEIYRDDCRGFSLFEINGSHHVSYCRHLFCIGKSFLESKLAGHDVHSYYFYVVVLHHRHFPHYVDDTSALYFAGYFTWEKQVVEFNLACILTLPCFAGSGTTHVMPRGGETCTEPPQLKGIGQFMIAVSYELAYRRHNVGTPEKPFSDLGAAAYKRFWRSRLFYWLHEQIILIRQSHRIPLHPLAQNSKVGKTDPLLVQETKEDHLGKRPRGGIIPTFPRKSSSQPKRRNTMENPIKIASDLSSEDSDTADRYPDDQEDLCRGTVCLEISIKEIASQVRLEEVDVLETVLGMGLIHYNAEHRTYNLMIPKCFVEWEVNRMTNWESSMQCATFNPALLLKKPSAGSAGVSDAHYT